MPRPQIKLYYKNVMAKVIGDEHGITPDQFEALAKKIRPLIVTLNEKKKKGKKYIYKIPYRNLPFDTKISEDVKDLVEKVKEGCENLVVLGIGGSALGNIALQTALNPYMYNLDDKRRPGPRLFVFDNIDPAQFSSFLDWVGNKLDRTIFNVISKAGQAAETLSQFMIVCDRLLRKFGPNSLKKHIIVTTGFDRNPLHEIAIAARLRCLEVPAGIGGRFSVLSAVGLFSAAMCGIDIDSLLAGARYMDRRIRRQNLYENHAAIIAAISYHFYNLGKKISVMMPYSYHLKDLSDWYRQLWAESLGKKLDLDDYEVHIGPTPIKALGATDQHSQIQLYREGPNDKLFTFLQVRNFNENLEIGPVPKCVFDEIGFLAGKDLGTLLNNEKIATEYALLQDKRPCLTIRFDRVNAYTVGQFIYLYEVTTSLTGALFNVNPYDQPAVELGKQATFALMGKPGFCKLVNCRYKDFARKICSATKVDTAYLV